MNKQYTVVNYNIFNLSTLYSYNSSDLKNFLYSSQVLI